MIWCIDSPGYGGSERDFIARAKYLVNQHDTILLSHNTDTSFLKEIQNLDVIIKYKRVGNDWKNFISSFLFFFTDCLKYKRQLFIIWAHHPDSNRWLQLFLAFFQIKFIVIERALPASTLFLKRSKLTQPLKKYILKRALATIICAHSHKENYAKLFFPKNLIVIVNSRNVKEINAQAEFYKKNNCNSIDSNVKIIAMTGRLDENKNQISIIQAISRVGEKSNYKLVLIGDGDIRDQLLKNAKQLDVNIEITGYVSDPIKYLANADLFVFTSLSEGLPGALIEAMAARVPCIATNIPGNKELILNERTGLLVKPKSPADIAVAIEQLTNDKILCYKLTKNAYEHVLKHYDDKVERLLWQQLFSNLQANNNTN
jgi:glycosyltransferase involved in cell wall biosynthesis